MNAVHVAIIKLSEGMLWRLRELVREIKKAGDVRNSDILSAARNPEQHILFREHLQLQRAGGDPRFAKKLSPSKMEAMKKRDHAQWIGWLSTDRDKQS